MSYVTGSHNAKVGMELQRGYFQRGDNNESSTSGVWYTVALGVPQLVTVQSPLAGWRNELNYNLGIFAQDQWTLNRLTLNGGVRLDMLNESTAAFTAAPHRWLPNRNNTFAAVENVPNWKDVNPRISAAYDLFGNGKTAMKASASRGVEQDSIRYAAANNPAVTLVTTTARVWNDNGNFVPDCDLANGADQDNRATGGDCCGPWQTPSFGSAIPGTRYDRGHHGRLGRAAVELGVLRRCSARDHAAPLCVVRVFPQNPGQLLVVDNEAYGANDFTEFSVTAPTNARLPQSGQVVTGFLDPIEIRAPQNVVKDASQFGNQKGHWNGFDMNLDARLKSGLYLQGGFGVGKAMADFCEIADDVPEYAAGGGGIRPASRHRQRHRIRRCWPPRDLDIQAGLPPGNAMAGSVQVARGVYAALVRRTRQRHVAEHSRSAARRVRHLQRDCQRRHDVRANDADNAGAAADQLRQHAERDALRNVMGRPVEPDRLPVHEDSRSADGPSGPQPGCV